MCSNVTPRTVLGALLLAAGVVQLLAVPGYYTAWSAAAGLAVGALLVAVGYLVVPQTSAATGLFDDPR